MNSLKCFIGSKLSDTILFESVVAAKRAASKTLLTSREYTSVEVWSDNKRIKVLKKDCATIISDYLERLGFTYTMDSEKTFCCFNIQELEPIQVIVYSGGMVIFVDGEDESAPKNINYLLELLQELYDEKHE